MSQKFCALLISGQGIFSAVVSGHSLVMLTYLPFRSTGRIVSFPLGIEFAGFSTLFSSCSAQFPFPLFFRKVIMLEIWYIEVWCQLSWEQINIRK